MMTILPPPATAPELQAAIAAAYARAKAARNDPYDRPNYRQQKEREHLAEAARLRRELTALLESPLAGASADRAGTALNHQHESLHQNHRAANAGPAAAAA